MSKKHRIVHVEWRTRDADRLRRFYGELFDWRFEDLSPGHYVGVDTGNDELHGGILTIAFDSDEKPGMLQVVEVKDLDAAEAKVKALGGQIVAERRAVEGWGRFTVVADLDGNRLAVLEMASKAERKAAARRHKQAEKELAKAREGRDADGKRGKKKGKKKRKRGGAEADAGEGAEAGEGSPRKNPTL